MPAGRVLLAVLTLSAAGIAAAEPLPPALRIAHRINENLPDLLRGLDRFAPVVQAVTDASRFRRCAEVTWDGVCGGLGVVEARQAARRCRDVLSGADGALARAHVPPDGMPALAVASLRQRIASEAFRLSTLHRVLARQGCADDTGAGDETADLTLLDDGRTVLVEPDRGLAPGAAYALRDRAGTSLRPARTRAHLAEARELDAARALAERLDAAAENVTTWPALPALTVALPEPVETAPFWPPPVRVVRSAAGDASSFVTTAAPVRREDPSPACPSGTEPADDVLAALPGGEPITAVRRGVLAASPPAGRPEAIPFLLALPREPARGVVLLLHSLNAGARVILDSLAGALGERGLASLALDLPGHGARPAGPTPFLEPADPAGFAMHAAQARREILALIDVLRRCPGAMGLPAAVPVARVGLIGYSVGATLGFLVLAVDADISPVVLTAPAADVFLWQRLLVARHVGLLRRVCVGAASGPTCPDDGACGGGLPCDHHPGIWLLSPAVAPAYRSLVAEVEPMARAAQLRPPHDARPLLVQGAIDDAIVFSTITRRLGDALGLPEVGAGEELPPRARHMWPGGHDFLDHAPVRAEAADFLARYWDVPQAPLH